MPGFAEKRSKMGGQWDVGRRLTEDLRVSLRRYRSFFDRLLKRLAARELKEKIFRLLLDWGACPSLSWL